MGKREEFENLVEDIINTKFNKYFKCSVVIDEVLSYRHIETVKEILNKKKREIDPYYNERKGLRPYVRNVLIDMKNKGKIIKYNNRIWKKL